MWSEYPSATRASPRNGRGGRPAPAFHRLLGAVHDGDRARAHRALGGWLQATYLPKKAMFSRRWEDARLYIFERGLIVTGPEGFQAAYDWASARVLQSITFVNQAVADARYTLIDRSGAAVSIGRGNDLLMPGQRERAGIRSHVKGAPFIHEGTWGPHIQQSIAQAQIQGAADALERGETLGFGPVGLSSTGVSDRKRSVDWGDLGEVHVANGMVGFPDGHRHRPALPSVSVHEIVNLNLFLALCHAFER